MKLPISREEKLYLWSALVGGSIVHRARLPFAYTKCQAWIEMAPVDWSENGLVLCFAAYRRNALLAVGGFPTNTIMNEDTYVAGKMLIAGWKVAYCAGAQVYHSHDYRYREEFKRYFDIGVFHAHTAWLQRTFGNAAGEGRRFVASELRYLIKRAPG